jgi:hypothetical protein
MRVGPSRPTTRKLIAVLALAALSLRSLIPAGFMPVPGQLFSLELCPDGLPSGMLAASMPGMAGMAGMPEMPGMEMDHHSGPAGDHSSGEPGGPPSGRHPAQIEHCVFGGASALALVAHVPALGVLLSAYILPAARFTPQRTGSFLLRIPLPRGPPATA